MQKLKSKVKPLIWECKDGIAPSLFVLDQKILPYEKKYIELKSYKGVISAIKDMTVRGAPLIGIAAAYGMALAAQEMHKSGTVETRHGASHPLIASLKSVGEEIKQSRPTAVNLKWAVDLILNDINQLNDTEKIIDTIIKRAIWIHEDDENRCEKIGEYGAKIVETLHATSLLTICNTGALATGGIGTALGVILMAYQTNPALKIFVSETRPRQQGARLTTFEFLENGVNCILIPDTASGFLMKKGEIDLVIVGADRIASNGDTANKIGTYQLAVLAKENNIPFYVAAPLSTFDLSIKNGDEIPIEERCSEEITNINGKPICANKVKVRNPAFDITPQKYISGIITERGVLLPDYLESIKKIFNAVAVV